ncbi:hypothetical protein QE197_19600 (plasmid) [Arsenophonus nasoniae]|uniref:Uncharacterized protein n=1 Tax=Arsenophonus nasoniae TaxID=638 RepID=A0A4P7KZX5_9GAMM|nr:hypothetical protein [Arsenophonus nasoniae]QBY45696.1 hypothetical protein ArsFIN_43070 [Arsenophonus nasoniae]WGM07951.1 hypothetical protein QE258_22095 [Arsenophonus nasoniae]WGM12902.1 hypothetical protein QE197_19600 [Arsenophonus nasoniae]WGM17608.1 hypothetical protein QE193_19795 [Arsenophonus nasoniae]
MIQPNKHRTTFRRLQPGMSVLYNEEVVKIIRLEPWDKHTDNWADESDNFCFFGKMPIR